jgi:hypothetical protein
MEMPFETCQRLVAALEQLVAEEQGIISAGEFAQILPVQTRIEPVMIRLAELLKLPAVTARTTGQILPRLAALQARRAASIETLAARMSESQTTLAGLDATRNQLGDLKSAYGVNRQMHRGTPAGLNLSA